MSIYSNMAKTPAAPTNAPAAILPVATAAALLDEPDPEPDPDPDPDPDPEPPEPLAPDEDEVLDEMKLVWFPLTETV